jgi:hypothetical protein
MCWSIYMYIYIYIVYIYSVYIYILYIVIYIGLVRNNHSRHVTSVGVRAASNGIDGHCPSLVRLRR